VATETGPAETVATARNTWEEQNAGPSPQQRDRTAHYAGGVNALDLLDEAIPAVG